MLATLVAVGLVLLGAALGRRILLLARATFRSYLEELCFSAGLGLGVLSLAIMAVGLLGGLRSGAVWAAALGAAGLLVPDAVRIVAGTARRARRVGLPSLKPFQWFLVAAILASLACGLVSSLAPPTAWDATTSHLKVPFLYLQEGAVFRLDDIHSNGPLNTAMLFIPAMGIGGDTAPALLHLAFLALGGLVLFEVARQHVSTTGALLAAAAYFLMPIGAMLGSEAVVDFPVVVYVALAFVALLRWWEEERPGWLVLSAVNLGLAMGTKYVGLYALAMFFAAAAVKVLAGKGRRLTLSYHAAMLLVLAVAVGCPWYVRNRVLTGNPFYPVFAHVIPTRHITGVYTGEVPMEFTRRQYPSDLLNRALLPVNYTLGFSRGVPGRPGPDGAANSPGPLFLALVPLIVVLRPVPRWATLAAALLLGALALIIPMYPLPRYVLPFVALCAPVLGYVFDALSGRAWARRTLCAVAVVVLLLQLVPFAGRAATRLRVAVGAESRRDYLRRVDDVYPMAEHVAAEGVLPPGASVLYVGERVYHFHTLGVDVTMGMPVRQALVEFPAFDNPAELHRRLRQLGFTHLVVNEATLAKRYPQCGLLLRALEDVQGIRRTESRKDLVLYDVAPVLGG